MSESLHTNNSLSDEGRVGRQEMGTNSVDVQSSLIETSSRIVKKYNTLAIMTAHLITYRTLLLEGK